MTSHSLFENALASYYDACATAALGDFSQTRMRLVSAVHDAWQDLQDQCWPYLSAEVRGLKSRPRSDDEEEKLSELREILEEKDGRAAIKHLPLTPRERDWLHVAKNVRDYHDHEAPESLTQYLRRVTRTRGPNFRREWPCWIEDLEKAESTIQAADSLGAAADGERCELYTARLFELLRFVRKALGRVAPAAQHPGVPPPEKVSHTVADPFVLLNLVASDRQLRRMLRRDDYLIHLTISTAHGDKILDEDCTLMDLCPNEEGGPILLLGDSGMGKSAALAFLAVQHTRQAIEQRDANRPIPLFVDLRDYPARLATEGESGDEMSSAERIRLALRRLGITPALASAIREELVPLVLNQLQWVLLIDSLDEAFRHEGVRTALMKDLESVLNLVKGRSTCVLVCRNRDYEAHREQIEKICAGAAIASVPPLDPRVIQRYLRLSDEEFGELPEDMQLECTNTFFLYLLKDKVTRETGRSEIADLTATGVFEDFVRHRLEDRVGDHWQEWRAVLSDLAFAMEEQMELRVPLELLNQGVDKRLAHLYGDDEKALEEHKWAPDLIRQVKRPLGAQDTDGYAEFWHHRLQSYLAGRVAASIWEQDQRAAKSLLRNQALVDVFPHVAAQVEKPGPLLAWLRWLDPPSLGRCLRYAGREWVPSHVRSGILKRFFKAAEVFSSGGLEAERGEPYFQGLREAAGPDVLRDIDGLSMWKDLDDEQEYYKYAWRRYALLRLCEWAREDDAVSILSDAVENFGFELSGHAHAQGFGYEVIFDVIVKRRLRACIPALERLLQRVAAAERERARAHVLGYLPPDRQDPGLIEDILDGLTDLSDVSSETEWSGEEPSLELQRRHYVPSPAMFEVIAKVVCELTQDFSQEVLELLLVQGSEPPAPFQAMWKGLGQCPDVAAGIFSGFLSSPDPMRQLRSLEASDIALGSGELSVEARRKLREALSNVISSQRVLRARLLSAAVAIDDLLGSQLFEQHHLQRITLAQSANWLHSDVTERVKSLAEDLAATPRGKQLYARAIRATGSRPVYKMYEVEGEKGKRERVPVVSGSSRPDPNWPGHAGNVELGDLAAWFMMWFRRLSRPLTINAIQLAESLGLATEISEIRQETVAGLNTGASRGPMGGVEPAVECDPIRMAASRTQGFAPERTLEVLKLACERADEFLRRTEEDRNRRAKLTELWEEAERMGQVKDNVWHNTGEIQVDPELRREFKMPEETYDLAVMEPVLDGLIRDPLPDALPYLSRIATFVESWDPNIVGISYDHEYKLYAAAALSGDLGSVSKLVEDLWRSNVRKVFLEPAVQQHNRNLIRHLGNEYAASDDSIMTGWLFDLSRSTVQGLLDNGFLNEWPSRKLLDLMPIVDPKARDYYAYNKNNVRSHLSRGEYEAWPIWMAGMFTALERRHELDGWLDEVITRVEDLLSLDILVAVHQMQPGSDIPKKLIVRMLDFSLRDDVKAVERHVRDADPGVDWGRQLNSARIAETAFEAAMELELHEAIPSARTVTVEWRNVKWFDPVIGCAIRLLARFERENVLPQIENLVATHPTESIDALTIVGGPKAESFLRTMASEGFEPDVRAKAVDALRRLQLEAGAP